MTCPCEADLLGLAEVDRERAPLSPYPEKISGYE